MHNFDDFQAPPIETAARIDTSKLKDMKLKDLLKEGKKYFDLAYDGYKIGEKVYETPEAYRENALLGYSLATAIGKLRIPVLSGKAQELSEQFTKEYIDMRVLQDGLAAGYKDSLDKPDHALKHLTLGLSQTLKNQGWTNEDGTPITHFEEGMKAKNDGKVRVLELGEVKAAIDARIAELEPKDRTRVFERSFWGALNPLEGSGSYHKSTDETHNNAMNYDGLQLLGSNLKDAASIVALEKYNASLANAQKARADLIKKVGETKLSELKENDLKLLKDTTTTIDKHLQEAKEAADKLNKNTNPKLEAVKDDIRDQKEAFTPLTEIQKDLNAKLEQANKEAKAKVLAQKAAIEKAAADKLLAEKIATQKIAAEKAAKEAREKAMREALQRNAEQALKTAKVYAGQGLDVIKDLGNAVGNASKAAALAVRDSLEASAKAREMEESKALKALRTLDVYEPDPRDGSYYVRPDGKIGGYDLSYLSNRSINNIEWTDNTRQENAARLVKIREEMGLNGLSTEAQKSLIERTMARGENQPGAMKLVVEDKARLIGLLTGDAAYAPATTPAIHATAPIITNTIPVQQVPCTPCFPVQASPITVQQMPCTPYFPVCAPPVQITTFQPCHSRRHK